MTTQHSPSGRYREIAVDAKTASLSIAISLLFLLWFLIAVDNALHWFLIPLIACGFVIGVDLVDWMRGRLGVFDPVGIMGLLGFHFFFVAPLLHFHWDFWMRGVAAPSDWRPWMGGMAILNFLGLLVYRWSRVRFSQFRAGDQKRYGWSRRIVYGRFLLIASAAALLSIALQMLAYWKFGGILGYIAEFDEGDAAFQGMGWVFALSERLPIVALIIFTAWARRRKITPSAIVVYLIILIFLVLSLLFGGLRGSRSATIWNLFWAVGIIHLWIRPFSKRMVYVGVLLIGVFMYLYGFYKTVGSEALTSLVERRENISELETRTGRTQEMLILGDLARADVQALLLQRLFEADYTPALGRTYIGGLTILVPEVVWSGKPMHKGREGTEIQYGTDSWRNGGFQSSRIYGLAGEWMLNFGVPLLPLAFLALGFAVGRTRRLMSSIDSDDARWLLVPFFINLCFVILCMDSDNIVIFIVKTGLIPAIIIAAGSRRVRIRPRPAARR